jgi:histidinol-phosphate aminotransferase
MRVKFNREQLDFIEESLSIIPGLTIFHSYANYILFDGGGTGKKGKDMVAYAQERGIILRPENPKYGSEGWFRVTIGTKEENQMVVDVIREFYSK